MGRKKDATAGRQETPNSADPSVYGQLFRRRAFRHRLNIASTCAATHCIHDEGERLPHYNVTCDIQLDPSASKVPQFPVPSSSSRSRSFPPS
ncbi:hypothetical protein K443DRAFT_15269 [Laccaria amethystina LaAM-08-1]|uniref:Uncharacterized protein n=1 Tax=Laccaria amethystina LaAM-08-1 TaxID=1095629 RepID=A0A0C9WYE8_9AGAR|nr:hypothetical protein K443DRAFT_15269 [Laccaria amethystina LaAM-08-1]